MSYDVSVTAQVGTEVSLTVEPAPAIELTVHAGPPGNKGDAGPGLPSGGASGQVPKKAGVVDYVTGWGWVSASEVTSAPSGNLAASDVQAALNELQSDVDTRATAAALTAHTGAAAGAHSASAISNTPSGNLAAAEVQAALNELQTDVDTRATSADLTAHIGNTASPHGIRRYSANVAMDGSQTTADVDVSSSITDARLAIWQLLDLSTNDFERLLVSIKTPSASTVHITSDPPLMSGNYRLIGVQL